MHEQSNFIQSWRGKGRTCLSPSPNVEMPDQHGASIESQVLLSVQFGTPKKRRLPAAGRLQPVHNRTALGSTIILPSIDLMSSRHVDLVKLYLLGDWPSRNPQPCRDWAAYLDHNTTCASPRKLEIQSRRLRVLVSNGLKTSGASRHASDTLSGQHFRFDFFFWGRTSSASGNF